MRAARIDGNKFVKAAQSVGLPTNRSTLNMIVNLVNEGMSVQSAAKKVADQRATKKTKGRRAAPSAEKGEF